MLISISAAVFGVAVLVAAGAWSNALVVSSGYETVNSDVLLTSVQQDWYSERAREAADQGAVLRKYASTWALILLAVAVLLVLYHWQDTWRMSRR